MKSFLNNRFLTVIGAIICLTNTFPLFSKPRYVTYERFGAKGNGVADDMPAIVAAHEYANRKGRPVKAREGRTYFISNIARTAVVCTDVDWSGAKFIIDDVDLDAIDKSVFVIKSTNKPFVVDGLNSLKAGQTELGIKLPQKSLILVKNDNKKIYIRKGLNRNNGTSQREMLVVEADGHISSNTPVIWNYDDITSAKAWPVDSTTIVIKGGEFTTIANQQPSKYRYHKRNIQIERSNVIIDGLSHFVTGELDHGAPYLGFLYVSHSSAVEIRNCILTGHKTYSTVGTAKKPVPMGSYDLGAENSAGISWINCTQTNSIDDTGYWGLFGSNFCKDLRMEGCRISRFDAHQGVVGIVLKNCTFGYQGLQLIGSGNALIEKCEVRRRQFIYLRDDYGSSWNGGIVIKDCRLCPQSSFSSLNILGGSNNGSHDFGYACYLPLRIDIDGLVIDDVHYASARYDGPCIFGTFNRNTGAEVPYPLVAKGEILLKNISVSSGEPLKLSRNTDLCSGYVIQWQVPIR